ncbi:MAG: phenylalanine--tRNA ligase subunit beta [Gammaproteobacteria bacterium]|nr:phenylalanine--tRNA ligase subunit beta [Gammaproteobacteria bacterium]
MQIPTEWIKDFCGLDSSSQEIIEQLTMAGVECDYLDSSNQEILNLSLTPNRADCFSVKGICRELAVLNDLTIPHDNSDSLLINHQDEIKIEIESLKDCPVFLTKIIKQIDIKKETPDWMVKRLKMSGFKSINIIVDITNYVMLETGQPLHAYDLNKIDSTIKVRRGFNNEKITLLDETTKKVDENYLLISDNSKALGIAGIMGGKDSGTSLDTESIVLESAYFNPITIMGRSRMINLHTESSLRFERGVDPSIQKLAIERATQLINQYSGGKNGCITFKKDDSSIPKIQPIMLRKERIYQILGITIANYKVSEILNKLEMEVKEQDYGYSGWLVTPPSFRFDINDECDLIEELARIYGYQNIAEKKELCEIKLSTNTKRSIRTNHINNVMVNRGYSEVINYSFISPSMNIMMGAESKTIDIQNPLSIEMSVMRTSLLPGLLQNLMYNLQRQYTNFKLFESAKIFLPKNKLNIEKHVISGISYGSNAGEQWGIKSKPIDFYDIKGDLEMLFTSLKINDQISYSNGSHPMLCPNKNAEIILNDLSIGYIGELNPELIMDLDLSQSPVLFEIDKDHLEKTDSKNYQDNFYFPSSRRDISLSMDENQEISSILKIIKQLEIPILKNIIIFDVYKGENIESGRKSIALGLIFQAKSRTLTDEEIDRYMSNIKRQIVSYFDLKIR